MKNIKFTIFIEKDKIKCEENKSIERSVLIPVNDGGSTCTGNPEVVGLSETPDDSDAVLHQEVLSQVGNALLGDDLKTKNANKISFLKTCQMKY